MVATPIGNLSDASERMKSTLSSSDVIAAEDTRVARKLLSALGITGKKIVSVREHNEKKTSMSLGKKWQGKKVAYISDAGTPAVSDPGAIFCAAFREMGFGIVPVPGPSAITSALSASGLASTGHVFGAFLPRRKKEFVDRLQGLSQTGLPVVVYESPKRVNSALAWIKEALGEDIRVCLCRELTKLHEQVHLGKPDDLLEILAADSNANKGEFTLVIDAKKPKNRLDDIDAAKIAREISAELPLGKSARIAARITGKNPRELYRLLSSSKKNG